jgi:hypothetical protein
MIFSLEIFLVPQLRRSVVVPVFSAVRQGDGTPPTNRSGGLSGFSGWASREKMLPGSTGITLAFMNAPIS